jgi:hypothetical protein
MRISMPCQLPHAAVRHPSIILLHCCCLPAALLLCWLLQEVSSGEELDELGELGSSDNEQERFLQVSCSLGEP